MFHSIYHLLHINKYICFVLWATLRLYQKSLLNIQYIIACKAFANNAYEANCFSNISTCNCIFYIRFETQSLSDIKRESQPSVVLSDKTRTEVIILQVPQDFEH